MGDGDFDPAMWALRDAEISNRDANLRLDIAVRDWVRLTQRISEGVSGSEVEAARTIVDDASVVATLATEMLNDAMRAASRDGLSDELIGQICDLDLSIVHEVLDGTGDWAETGDEDDDG